jgi:CheY-like chemotaxis protein
MHRPVLVVEDNRDDLELTLLALERAPIASPVIAVDSGPEALDFLARLGRWADDRSPLPAFILLDMGMRLMNGREVAQIVRATPSWRHIPVVAMSTSARTVDIARAYDSGVNAYVVKPIEFADYVGTIRRIAVMWGVHNQSPLRMAA